MKKLFLIFISIFITLLFGCDDSTGSKPNLKLNTIRIVDSVSLQPLTGYKAVVYFIFEPAEFENPKDFQIYPNPVFGFASFSYQLNALRDLKIHINNKFMEKTITIVDEINLKPGTHKIDFRISDSANIDYGLYNALLFLNKQKTDSLNFIYCDAEAYTKLTEKNIFKVINIHSDSIGSLTFGLGNYFWIGEKFMRISDDGVILNKLQISNNFKVEIYTHSGEFHSEYTIAADDLKKGVEIKVNTKK